MKDAVRLAIYFATVIILGALLAPILFWTGQSLATHRVFSFLGQFDFETFFHRALLLPAAVLIWPLFLVIEVRQLNDLDLQPNPQRWRHLLAGFCFAVVPLLCCGAALIALGVYSLRPNIAWGGVASTIAATLVVPLIEESFFRGLVLGILLRSGRKHLSIFLTSALFAIVHFLKAPERTSTIVTWTSGFRSIAYSFAQFNEPMLVATAFTTLFLIGWTLGDVRLRTHSLWLPVGLHAGWILGNGTFNKFAHRDMLLLPWLGRNLLVGLIPLGIAGATWLLVRLWLKTKSNGN